MDLNKEIRETIEFYCGGTYENRKLAADKILQICKNKPLTIHSVVVPKGTLSNLDEAIKKAKPNMDKIKDVDKHLDSIR